MYKKVSLPSVAVFQYSWIFLAIALVVGPDLLFVGLAFGLVLGPLPLEVRQLNTGRVAWNVVCGCKWWPLRLYVVTSEELYALWCNHLSECLNVLFWYCRGWDGSQVRSLEVRQLNIERVAWNVVCGGKWWPLCLYVVTYEELYALWCNHPSECLHVVFWCCEGS